MAIKKSELYSSIWKSCDQLRGNMDASQYKDYVLVLLFVKYISDKYAGQSDALIEVPTGASFGDMVALKGNPEIGEKVNKIISKVAEANELSGILEADFNDSEKLGKGKALIDRLSSLIGIFEGLNFGRNRADGDDLLGDAYEYLMRHFSIQSGKSKGQFYTPAEVSRIIAKVIGVSLATSADQTIYDPACGSGSLLLKAFDEAKEATGLNLTIYGQENDLATSGLAKMNMILHDCPSAEIWKDNSLSEPHFRKPNGQLETFDFVVANPPFSDKSWSTGFHPAEDEFKRFEFGVPPTKNGDYAFLLHILTSMKSKGKGAVILPHGVLFRGGAEASIRRNIVDRGYIKGIIGLPANLFYGTGIPACIIVLDKENADARKGVFMIDASKGFIKDGNKNRLRAQDIHKIVDIFNRQAEVEHYARMVSLEEITNEKNDYNLNLPRYIDTSEPEDLQDIEGHLRGGIPTRDIEALADYWKAFPAVRDALLEAVSARPNYCQLKIEADQVKSTIYSHPQFRAFNENITGLYQTWKAQNETRLQTIQVGERPKKLIQEVSEKLLQCFTDNALLDAYDVYQHIMDYWAETMQDDVYLIAQEGWKAILDGQPNTDLIPEILIIKRYFANDQKAIEALEAETDAITQQLEELEEEHGGDEGLLAEARNDKDKITIKGVKERLKIIKNNKDFIDERKVLEDYKALADKEGEANYKVKKAIAELNKKVATRYKTLTEAEIKQLVIEDKWLARLEADVQSELNRISQGLTGRIRQLAERYETPLPKLKESVAQLSARVDEHLKHMGAVW